MTTECKHKRIKEVLLKEKQKVWYCLFIYANQEKHEEYSICIKCGKKFK